MKGILFPWGCFRLLCPVSDEMMQRSTILFVFHSPHTLPCQSKGRDRFLNLFSTSSCLHTLWGELSLVKLWPFLGHLSGESFLKLDPQISPNDGWLWSKLRYKKHELFFTSLQPRQKDNGCSVMLLLGFGDGAMQDWCLNSSQDVGRFVKALFRLQRVVMVVWSYTCPRRKQRLVSLLEWGFIKFLKVCRFIRFTSSHETLKWYCPGKAPKQQYPPHSQESMYGCPMLTDKHK